MPHYIMLAKWTEQGVRGARDSPKRVENARRMAQKLGGSMQVFFTMGEYDTVNVVEMPNDETFNKFAIWLGTQGNIRTKSLKAWTTEEAGKMMTDIPQ